MCVLRYQLNNGIIMQLILSSVFLPRDMGDIRTVPLESSTSKTVNNNVPRIG